jgi:uncharacterized DUF497 family protein
MSQKPQARDFNRRDRSDVPSIAFRLSRPAHSHHEERFKAIGKGQEGRNIPIVFTIRQRRESRLIRPISARYMHRKEVEHYEKETARSQKR